jgi:hypothetical protein
VGSTFYFQLIHKSSSSLSITVCLAPPPLPVGRRKSLWPDVETVGAEPGISAGLRPYTYSVVVLAQLYIHLQKGPRGMLGIVRPFSLLVLLCPHAMPSVLHRAVLRFMPTPPHQPHPSSTCG